MNPEEINEPTTEPSPIDPTASVVQIETTQYQTIVESAKTINLLTNRVEFMLLLNVVLITLLIYKLMRSKA